ncbi:MAG: hypothetical protein FGF48_10830 [Candidatus Brockarchaeota archaeon]|nr:hypothetical protein [Candidatus Brockarchaeota archaeon]
MKAASSSDASTRIPWRMKERRSIMELVRNMSVELENGGRFRRWYC